MRKIVIGVAFAATAAAAWFAPDDSADVISSASARPYAVAPPVAAPPEPVLPEIRPREADEDLGNAFAKQSWQPEAPKKVMMAAAAANAPVIKAAAGPPGAPSLPIRFLGRFVDDGRTAFFLQVDDRNIVAHVGDKIDDSYRLESADNGALVFTYLPLNQKQELAVGDMN